MLCWQSRPKVISLMSVASRSKRQRGTDEASGAAAVDARPNESVWESLQAGRDPHRNGKTLAHVDPVRLEGVACDADGEQRAFVLTETEHLSLFFPSAVTRDKNKPLLPDWSFIQLLPPAWYAIVFAVQGQPCFRAVSASKLSVDGYPTAGKAGDPDRAAGFTGGESLRLEAGMLTRADVRTRLIETLTQWRSEASACDGTCAQCKHASIWHHGYAPRS